MKQKLSVFLLFLLWAMPLFAAVQVDTVVVRASRMNREVKNVIILPADYNESALYPVIYLLHGYGGDYSSWLKIKPDLPQLATEKQVIFVCPDGLSSWYWDSPVNKDMQFETYVSKDLVGYMDAHYRTVADRSGRAIAGLSMGGHGALWLSIRHRDTFGAAGSMSGGVDIRPFPEKWKMSVQLGEKNKNPEVWEKHTVINLVPTLKNGDLAMIIDCGYDDFFFEVNNNMHNELLNRGIMHDFIVRPGGHTSKYWNNSIDYQIVFFKKYFENARK